MSTHTIKKLDEKGMAILWCGREYNQLDFAFVDAGHLALSVGGFIPPCKNCVKAVIKQLSKELAC